MQKGIDKLDWDMVHQLSLDVVIYTIVNPIYSYEAGAS